MFPPEFGPGGILVILLFREPLWRFWSLDDRAAGGTAPFWSTALSSDPKFSDEPVRD